MQDLKKGFPPEAGGRTKGMDKTRKGFKPLTYYKKQKDDMATFLVAGTSPLELRQYGKSTALKARELCMVTPNIARAVVATNRQTMVTTLTVPRAEHGYR